MKIKVEAVTRALAGTIAQIVRAETDPMARSEDGAHCAHC